LHILDNQASDSVSFFFNGQSEEQSSRSWRLRKNNMADIEAIIGHF
jgi:hypothetical protein